MGKANLAPLPEHTVPRHELCAEVLTVHVAKLISSEIDTQLDDTTLYSDKIIDNETRRFLHLCQLLSPADKELLSSRAVAVCILIDRHHYSRHSHRLALPDKSDHQRLWP